MEGVDKRKVCQNCGRGRKDHPTPFGANCTLPPLSDSERQAVINALQDKEESVEPHTSGAEGSGATGIDSEYQAKIQDLLKEQEKLELQRKQTLDAINIEEKVRKEKQAEKYIAELQAKLDATKATLEDEQAKLINLRSENQLPASAPNLAPIVTQPGPQVTMAAPPAASGVDPVYTVADSIAPGVAASVPGLTSTIPGVHRAPVTNQAPVVAHVAAPRPPPGFSMIANPSDSPVFSPTITSPGILDPSLQVYANALASSCGATAGSVPAPAAENQALGATALQLIKDNPLLAAACGMKEDRAAADGKWVAENFVFKVLKDKDKPNYAEFINGAFRMLQRRIKEKKSVDNFINYYEALSGFAVLYKWPAVLELHESLSKNAEIGSRMLTDPINFSDAYAFLHARSMLPDRQSDYDSRVSRREGGRMHRRRDRGPSDFDSESDDRRPLFHHRANRICIMFNTKSDGCYYGKECKYMHACALCAERNVTAYHSALVCRLTGSGAQLNNAPAGASHASGPQ